MLRHSQNRARNSVVEEKLANTEVPLHQLFYLPEDPGERHDLAAQKPEVLAKMVARLDAVIASGRQRGD